MDIISFLELINIYVIENYLISLMVFICLLIFYTSLSIPGNLFLFLFSGFIFGFYLGYIVNIISITIGSFIFFKFSKYFFKYFFKNTYKNYSLKLNSIIKDSSYEYLVLLRLVPGPPLIAQNLCLSLLKISKIKLLITTFIGFTPLMLITSYIGSKVSNFVELKSFDIKNIFSFNFLIILIILISLVIIRIVIKKRPS